MSSGGHVFIGGADESVCPSHRCRNRPRRSGFDLQDWSLLLVSDISLQDWSLLLVSDISQLNKLHQKMFDSGPVLMVRLDATGLTIAGYQDCTDQVNRSVYNVGNLNQGNSVIGANGE